MALTPEQVTELKNQLKQQVENLPPDKKQEALKQIDELSSDALEEMLDQQKQKQGQKSGPQKNIFRMIVDKDISSVIADENDHALAVLDINPISKAHLMIIPKKPVSDAKSIPMQAFALAKKISKRINSRLKAKTTDIQTESKFGEAIINLIPSYENQPQSNQRTKASIEELESIAKKIRPLKKKAPVPKPIVTKLQPVQKTDVLKLPRRIP